MTELFSHIVYLLRRHDCVVLPGIGAFVAVSRDAQYDCESGSFIPPRREITFNGAIKSDDGLISWSVARRDGISFEQASALVSGRNAEILRRLDVEGAVHIDRIGWLRHEREGVVSFVPDSHRLLPALPQLRLKPYVPTPVISLEIEHRSQERTVAVVRVPLRRRLFAAAASVALLLGLGFTLSTPIDVSTAHTAAIGSMTFTPPAEPKVDVLPVPEGLELAIAMPSEGAIVAPEKPVPAAPERYVMVVASLPTRLQAEQYVAREGSGRLNILEKDGKFRVYITSGTTQADVTEKAAAISGFRESYPDAWVCRK